MTNDFLSLHDFRCRVFTMYRERNDALAQGKNAQVVCERFRSERNTLFATHPQSAYDEAQRAHFRGLPYFPYDPAWCIEARIDTNVVPEKLLVETSGDGAIPMEAAARVTFSVAGRKAALTVYWIDVYGGGLFLPFRDATAPDETYGGGRYLFDTVKGSDFVQLPAPDHAGDGIASRILLDFNYAYNPSCAYNYRWSCPLAPPRNHLPFPVRAGEKKPA